jgi:raffinose/stachyose/melibiose transport system permease protein
VPPAGIRRLTTAVTYLILTSWAIVVSYPLLVMVFSSFKSLPEISADAFGPPPALRLENYAEAWDKADFPVLLRNSVVIASLSVALLLLLSSSTAYVLGRHSFRGRTALYLLIVLGLLVPYRVAVLPYFGMMRDLHLLGTVWPLVLFYTATAMPFAVFLLVAFYQTLPAELEEAAVVDGASWRQVFWSVSLPLMRPALATVAVVNFVAVWNDFFLPLIFLPENANTTIPVGILQFRTDYFIDYHLLMPAMVMASVPAIVVFIFAGRQFLKGVTVGALK